MSDTQPTRDEAIATLNELIHDVRICMLTTLDPDGMPWSRPMAIQEADFDGDLWFFTRADSEKVDHIQARPKVGAAFAKPSDQEYVTMAGTARVLNDRSKIDELWAEPLRAWFPDGKDDPQLRLIHVSVDRAEYWDSPSSVITYALSYAKAVVTGQPGTDAGEDVKVSL